MTPGGRPCAHAAAGRRDQGGLSRVPRNVAWPEGGRAAAAADWSTGLRPPLHSAEQLSGPSRIQTPTSAVLTGSQRALRLHLCAWEHGETEDRESAPHPGLTPPSDRQTAALSTAVQLLPEFISYF